MAAIARVREQTSRIEGLLSAARSTKLANRSLNEFLVLLMEGKVREGTEAFGEFIVKLISGLNYIPGEIGKGIDCESLFSMYIMFAYGDSKTERFVPLEIAQAYNVLPEEVARLVATRQRLWEREKNEWYDLPRKVWSDERRYILDGVETVSPL